MSGGFFDSFVRLLFPALCASCRSALVLQERFLCTCCLYNLPKTNFHLDHSNPMSMLFWGRINLEAAAAMYYFERGSKCRKIMHQIKYRGHKELAMYLGTLYGRELFLCSRFTGTDIIIPVPLHPERLKKRGFNQSEWFGRGLSGSLQKVLCAESLVRISGTGTQTSKSRTERWENVEGCFSVVNPHKIINKHILLVDDVVTTGATIESCASVLLEHEGVKISVLTIGYA